MRSKKLPKIAGGGENENAWKQDIAECLPYAVLVFNGKGRIAYANPAFFQILGQNQQKIIGKEVRIIFSNRDQDRGMGVLQNALRNQKKVQDFQVILTTGTGKDIPMALSIIPLMERELGIVTLSDVRQLQGLLQGLQRAQMTLQEQVERRTKELREKVEELEQFHRLTVGREMKMVELKKELEQLKEHRGIAEGNKP
ncbi:MAG: PAS domain-containing protein [Candidatus Wildermuthbacteria bacterium]|nr:PAS domain-containing protein [Candidatus Wildermuthbacteria bacterium]